MSDDLDELYQQVILDHCKAPRNFRRLPAANHKAEGFNPLCGDHFTVYVDLEGDAIRDIGFEGSGCAISKASASMMTQIVKGKTRAEAEEIFGRFHQLAKFKTVPNRVQILVLFEHVEKRWHRVTHRFPAWRHVSRRSQINGIVAVTGERRGAEQTGCNTRLE